MGSGASSDSESSSSGSKEDELSLSLGGAGRFNGRGGAGGPKTPGSPFRIRLRWTISTSETFRSWTLHIETRAIMALFKKRPMQFKVRALAGKAYLSHSVLPGAPGVSCASATNTMLKDYSLNFAGQGATQEHLSLSFLGRTWLRIVRQGTSKNLYHAHKYQTTSSLGVVRPRRNAKFTDRNRRAERASENSSTQWTTCIRIGKYVKPILAGSRGIPTYTPVLRTERHRSIVWYGTHEQV